VLPMLLRVKVRDEKSSFGFFIPLIIVYMLFVPIIILGGVAYAILLIIPETTKQARSYLQLIMSLPSLLSASIGTEIEIHSDDKDISMYVK